MKIRESTVHYYVQSFIHIADQCQWTPAAPFNSHSNCLCTDCVMSALIEGGCAQQ
jgi:hypothetical protein